MSQIPPIRLRKPPVELDKVIRLVNLVRPDYEMVELKEAFFFDLQKEFTASRNVCALEVAHGQLVDFFSSLPFEFQRYLWGLMFSDDPDDLDDPDDPDDPPGTQYVFRENYENWVYDYFRIGPPQRSITEYLTRADSTELAIDYYYGVLIRAGTEYNFIRGAREALARIVFLNSTPLRDEEYRAQYFNATARIPVAASVKLAEDGILWAHLDRFGSAIQGVEAKRIRQCENCGLFYWAGRIDSPCCSKSCANARRTRQYRFRRSQGYYQGAKD